MTELSDADFLGNSAPSTAKEMTDSQFLGAAPTAGVETPKATEVTKPAPGGIAKPTFGRALTYGIANAVPFAHDIGSAIQAGESYLPKALQTDDLGNVDNKASFSQRMAQQKARINATDAANQEAYPVTSFVTPLAASVAALPMAGPVDAISSGISRLAPRLGGLAADSLATGVVGSGYGAAYGAGSGDTLDERLGAAKTGAIFGGVGGAATPVVAKGLASTIGAGTKFVKGVFNPNATGVDMAVDSIARDQASGLGVKMTPQQFEQARTSGQPVVAGDLGGEATRKLARAAANISPEAKAMMQDPLASRFATQNTRTQEFVDSLYGGKVDPEAMKMKLADEARSVNNPAYKKAYADGANGVWNPGVDMTPPGGDHVPNLPELAEHPRVQEAIKGATTIAKEDAVSSGRTLVRNPFVTGADGGLVLKTNPDGSQAIPSLQFWDYVKRGLDAQRSAALRTGDKDAARRIGIVKDQLLTNLDESVKDANGVSSYKIARQGAWHMFGADNALDAGAEMLKPSVTPFQVRQAVAAARTPLQRQALDYGAASAVVNKAVNAGDGRDVVKLFDTPAIREKLGATMRPDRFARLEAQLRAEASMNILKTAVSGNSTTMEQAHGALGVATKALASPIGGAMAGTALGYEKHGFDLEEMLKYGAYGFVGGAMGKWGKGINAKMMQGVAEGLASSDPAVANAAIERIAKSKQMMEALRQFSSHLAALPATGAGRGQVSVSSPTPAQMEYAPAQ